MGDSIKWCMEREAERKHEEYKKLCAARKKNVSGVELDTVINNLLKALKNQQLSRTAWTEVDALRDLWFGKE